MKKFVVAMVLTAGLTLAGCGSSSSPKNGNINGTWTAVLTDTSLNFATTVAVNTDNSLSVTNFSFSTSGQCFVSGETESGSFVLSGDFNGNVTGQFQFKVTSGTPSGNTLTLTGTVNGNTITGMWTLSGSNLSACNGSGTFTMTKS